MEEREKWGEKNAFTNFVHLIDLTTSTNDDDNMKKMCNINECVCVCVLYNKKKIIKKK